MRQSGVEILRGYGIEGVEGVLPVSTTTVYSSKFLLADVIKLGLQLTAAGTGVDILVKLEISQDGTNFAIETGYSSIVNLLNTTKTTKTILDAAVPAAKWGRLSFTGQNANPADAAVTGFINPVRDLQ